MKKVEGSDLYYRHAIRLKPSEFHLEKMNGLRAYYSIYYQRFLCDNVDKGHAFIKSIYELIQKDSVVDDLGDIRGSLGSVRPYVSLFLASDKMNQLATILTDKSGDVEYVRTKLREIFPKPTSLKRINDKALELAKTHNSNQGIRLDESLFFQKYVASELCLSMKDSFPLLGHLYQKYTNEERDAIQKNFKDKIKPITTDYCYRSASDCSGQQAPTSVGANDGLVTIPLEDTFSVQTCVDLRLGSGLEKAKDMDSYFVASGGLSEGSGYPLKPYRTFPFRFKIVLEHKVNDKGDRLVEVDESSFRWVLMICFQEKSKDNNQLSNDVLRALCSSSFISKKMSEVVSLSDFHRLATTQNRSNGFAEIMSGEDHFIPGVHESSIGLSRKPLSAFRDSNKTLIFNLVFCLSLFVFSVIYLITIYQGLNVLGVLSGVKSWYDPRVLGGFVLGGGAFMAGCCNFFSKKYEKSSFGISLSSTLLPILIGLCVLGFSYSLFAASLWWSKPLVALTGVFDPRFVLGVVSCLLSAGGTVLSAKNLQCFSTLFSCFSRNISNDQGITKKAGDFLVSKAHEQARELLDVLLESGFTSEKADKMVSRDKAAASSDKRNKITQESELSLCNLL
ncbi:MAG TPA: hypothetical protein QF353_04170 [Gammaproteobacteria bacterium]|nr:hypothetical protein [Gammaproteobacteria bacterium]